MLFVPYNSKGQPRWGGLRPLLRCGVTCFNNVTEKFFIIDLIDVLCVFLRGTALRALLENTPKATGSEAALAPTVARGVSIIAKLIC